MDRIIPHDMPKLESPFVRKVDSNNHYVVTPEVADGYQWVFVDPKVMAIEKLDGTNVSVIVENGTVTSVWNRTARIPFPTKAKRFINEAIMNSYDRGYLELPDGQWFGEVVGPKVGNNPLVKPQVNPYRLDENLWIPFSTYSQKHLQYTSWGKYPKTYESITEWFKTLMPLFAYRVHGRNTDVSYAEGVVFTHPDGRMAKLRVDMFPFYYENARAKGKGRLMPHG